MCATVLSSCAAPEKTEPETESVSETEDKYEEIEEIDSVLTALGFKGEAYVTDGDTVLYDKGFGTANKEQGTEVTADTQFCIASVSKQFAATSILLLEEQGKLSVDDTIDKYFPDYKYAGKITIENLLTMRSGIPEYTTKTDSEGNRYDVDADTIDYDISENATSKENRTAIEEWFFEKPLDFEPGEEFSYSNSNFMLLAEIVEQISGKDYEEFVQKNIFDKLGMKDSTFTSLYDFSSERFAQPHGGDDGGEFFAYRGANFGAGDIISTANDLNIWLNAMRDSVINSLNGETLLSKESIAKMTKNYSEANDDFQYGYGLMLMANGFGHTGAITSYRSVIYCDPLNEINIILLSSTKTVDINVIFNRFYRTFD